MTTIYIDREAGQFVAKCTSEFGGRQFLAMRARLSDCQLRALAVSGYRNSEIKWVLTDSAKQAVRTGTCI